MEGFGRPREVEDVEGSKVSKNLNMVLSMSETPTSLSKLASQRISSGMSGSMRKHPFFLLDFVSLTPHHILSHCNVSSTPLPPSPSYSRASSPSSSRSPRLPFDRPNVLDEVHAQPRAPGRGRGLYFLPCPFCTIPSIFINCLYYGLMAAEFLVLSILANNAP